MTLHVEFESKKRLPLADEADIERELRAFEAEEKQRLGLEDPDQWVEDMANLGFTKSERSNITILVGGLTMAHDYFIEGALRHLDYSVLALDCPDNEALRIGKEFGNRGQCNPTYFTVGNLVKFLTHLRDEKGMSTADIIDKFVFLTAGACGPCRFGMYTTEYRKALRDAGFDGFRVMLFQQQGGLSQATGEDSGLELGPPFFLALLKALVTGDVLNALGYRIRPYEVTPGETDATLARVKRDIHATLSAGGSALMALHRAKKELAKVPVDRTRIRPRTSIIGEFWAMTTEGDGNYALQRFLESEGSECDIQLVTAWILYNIWEVHWDTENRASLRGADAGKYGLKDLDEMGVFTRRVGLWAADKALRSVFQTFAFAGGLQGYHLPDMHEVAAVAAPHYNNDLRGGEGHMEVGKLILNVVKNKCNMTLSVKPFGCMPSSSVSDGVQSLITEKFPGTIYCAVETSGDGAVNFYSRVQMYLFKAKQAAQQEVDQALSQYRLTIDDVTAYLAQHPHKAHALYKPAHYAGCTTADLVHEVGRAVTIPAWRRAGERLKQGAIAGAGLARTALASAPERARASYGIGKELAEILRDKGPQAGAVLATRAKRGLARLLPMGESDSRQQGGFAAAAG
ncbi:MAG: 2-hydroxyglutaryl-CoA dehydratase [Polyangiaceae bacterium]